MANKYQDEEWDLIIKPSRGLLEINLKEIWHYRDLVKLLAKRDLLSSNKQTLLGQTWIILNPLFTCFIYMFIFGRIAKLSTDSLPPILFYLSGIMFWNFFTANVYKSSGTFLANAGLFGKAYFPRLVVPISGVLVFLLNFCIQFLFTIIFMIYFSFNGYSFNPSLLLWTLPVLLGIEAMLAIGLGLIVSSITIKFRDINNLFSLFVQLLMFATPVVFPASSIPEALRPYVWLNPMTAILEATRFSLFGTGIWDTPWLIYSLLVSVFIFMIGVISFNQTEKNFIDTV
ncbi:MAG: ABC transporter permease [Cytophagales bacterium]|nr:ABC transporter permease [Cytophagales bacterium]